MKKVCQVFHKSENYFSLIGGWSRSVEKPGRITNTLLECRFRNSFRYVFLLEMIVTFFYSTANSAVKVCDHRNLKLCNSSIKPWLPRRTHKEIFLLHRLYLYINISIIGVSVIYPFKMWSTAFEDPKIGGTSKNFMRLPYCYY